nr:hypothetical protein [Tanacetum cinerariifolium]
MANENVLVPAPMRSDDQILPIAAWETLMFKAKTRAYCFWLDEDWFRLYANLLREAPEITPVDHAHQFVSPPLGSFPKAKIDKDFRMKIPEELITDNIKNASYYIAYLEMVEKHERRITAEKEGGKKKTAPKADKPIKPAPAKQAKPATAKQPKLNVEYLNTCIIGFT